MTRPETIRELEALDARDELEGKAERARRRRRMVLRLLPWAAISALSVPVIGVPGAIALFVGPLLLVVVLALGFWPAFVALSWAAGEAASGWRKTKPDGPIARLVRRLLRRSRPTAVELLARGPRKGPPD